MAEQFFIKRGEKINGPFTVEKLQALKKAKKLKADDEISQSRKGPWDRLGAVYKSILKEDRIDDYEDDVVFYEDDDDGYEDGYVAAPPARGKQSQSTKVKRSSQHQKQSSGKLPLIIVGCFLGVGLVGAGVYGVIAMVGGAQETDNAGADKPSFQILETPNEFARFFEGTWESEITKTVGADDSVSSEQERSVFTYAPDKTRHGPFEFSRRRDENEWIVPNMKYGTWTVESVDVDTNQATIKNIYSSEYGGKWLIDTMEWEITMVSATEFHMLDTLMDGTTGKVVWHKKEGENPKTIKSRQVIAAIKKMGADVTVDEDSPDSRVIKVRLENCIDAALIHLKEFTELRELELYDGQITDAGLIHLKDLTNLTDLGLGKNKQITDAGLVHLKGLTSLTHLDLSSNTKVTDAGLVHLKGLTKLERLDLRGMYTEDGKEQKHNITTAGVKRFTTALPKCEVWYVNNDPTD
jgi:hypothetical protein